MKKFLIILISVLAIFIASGAVIYAKQLPTPPRCPVAIQANFWGDPQTKIYHHPTCKYVKKIKHGVAIDSPTTAARYGFRPCKKCKPARVR